MLSLKNVYSSHISSIGYDPATGTLQVHFSNGSIVDYLDVPSDIGDSILQAPSIGEALHAHVRGQFKTSYVKKVRHHG